MIALVAAVADNGIIGTDNDLPWRLPDDWKFFKQLTSGHTVVMGRKTYESIVRISGGPLPNRNNVVLTRDEHFAADGVRVIHDTTDIPALAPDVYVIGGAQVYASTLAIADVLFVTEVHTDAQGDVSFPPIDPAVWHETSRRSHPSDDRHEFAFDFVTYERT